MKTSHKLILIRAALYTPQMWTQHAMARDNFGHSGVLNVGITHVANVCVIGAVMYTNKIIDCDMDDAREFIHLALQILDYDRGIIAFNDYKETTHAMVFDVLTTAIRLALEEENK